MGFPLFVVVLVVAWSGAVYGEGCETEFEKMHSCMADAMKEKMASLPEPPKPDLELVSKCFTSNGCNAPDFSALPPPRPMGGPPPPRGEKPEGEVRRPNGQLPLPPRPPQEGPPRPPQEGPPRPPQEGPPRPPQEGPPRPPPPPMSADMEKMKQCHEQVGTKIHSNMDACLKDKIPDFAGFKEDKHSKFDKNRGPHHGGMDKHHGPGPLMMFMKMLKDQNVCPESFNKEGLIQCLKALAPPKPTEEEMKAKMEEMCTQKKTCFEKMTPECQTEIKAKKEEMAKIKKSACECASEKLLPMADDIKKEFQTCIGSDAAAEPESAESSEETEEQEHKRFDPATMVEMICKNDHFDLCPAA